MTQNRLSISDPIRTNDILRKYKLRAKKSLGQNFLTNEKVLNDIVDASQLKPDEIAIEIGPGIGALTEKLAQVAEKVFAFEVDQNLIPVLADTLSDYDNIEVFNQDILDVDLDQFVKDHGIEGKTIKVVANLPYYITTPIMLNLINSDYPFQALVLMMQKEVAERITAEPGHRQYGSLTIGVQTLMKTRIDRIVGKNSFIPRPKVDSAVVVLERLEHPNEGINDPKYFNKVIRSSFAQKRKSLMNNLLNWQGRTDDNRAAIKQIFADCDVAENARAEQLSIPQFKEMANELQETFSK
ncbi:16S rRNA (adenine(1518)-N(6)/adenine(1519)-N(6))-dimethyltransferase RsmA [Companilactobacillus sp.]|jgi:16S rRNA (adenine1518-N6/adenine1519-N6)-dimethyltransferase|uniref:16S rRNA (adenine(1518)-N(6)/adenine(1519)-N(6))- dimethyltransferase RsmA n=1 Tax=Companilactobacillus sp. TaxID=2767905 RepID=UPI0025C3EE81|nr:16S rRNA (adenine(1518)-N(6)/adenine(1519)-N(6))-dimethyltransferase RsmA [Companilactobacillus sp.]MCH4010108.1 16S rRNA (adenine(1518)-N(6)/adenine(1519)-N(6))-dimethyltransferase RsmA [Companilactobacillus sp.]MCH4052216.1 16S rRNA (adenine(1518)-N(6)/adenine(1519)-N(6))-dimethyltransferase RsmA [Companilactobacillus sp.]MCH4078050.1 16S rRNA (adenine(1518)-N(6)/adenine(1519)-N(6))-dimethyltransferase RsmA [Companilactobacillus sp.]MCH4126626.1 16S rRNA (adenine(1518)-N(6)/adenine(1519)-N